MTPKRSRVESSPPQYAVACRVRGSPSHKLRRRGIRLCAIAFGGLLYSAMAAAQQPPGPDVPAFSSALPVDGPPPGWIPFKVAPWKARTDYKLVAAEDGATVLQAVAERSASGLVMRVDVDPTVKPIVSWRWRVTELVEGADNSRRATEDAAARVILEFDGNEGGAADLASATRFMRQLADPTTPHRVLMYIWSSSNPVASILVGPLSDHIRMVVVSTGSMALGQWQAHTRNYRADYLRAFGRPPGRLTAIGVMSDADNTGARAEAFFGNITLGADQRAPP